MKHPMAAHVDMEERPAARAGLDELQTTSSANFGAATALPRFRRALAVGAHPDDESFGLGAILSTLVDQGTRVWLVSFTHGEASTLGGSLSLREVRSRELTEAATELGLSGVHLVDHPDGKLATVPLEGLVDTVHSLAGSNDVDVLLVFDEGGITGHPDHCRATDAALAAAERLDVPVLAWAIPDAVAGQLNEEFGTGFVGRRPGDMDFLVNVDRARQRLAIARHASQSADNPVLWRRLELLGDTEWLRYLRPRKNEQHELRQ